MILNLFSIDLILVIPGLFMVLNLLILILYSVFNSVKVFSRYLIEDVIIIVSYILLLTAMLFANQITENWKCFNFYLSWDPLSNFSVIFLILIAVVILISGYTYFKYENLFSFEFGVLVYFYIIGVYLLFLSNDFFSLYLAVELQSFALYVLCAYKRDAFSSEAGLKYFVLGAFSSGLLLFGVSMIYGFTGTTNFDDLYSLFLPNTFFVEMHSGILVGLVFFSVGFLFKLGVFPFHMWVPDVYEGAPTIVTALLASLSKFAIAAAFIKIYIYVFFSFAFYWYRIFIVLGILSVIFASIAAIYQEKIKRLLAYSGVAHMGYVLLALSSNSLEGLFSAYYYLIVYSLTSLAVFIILLSVRRYTNFLKLKTLAEFSSLFRNNPPMAFSFSLLMFSLAGIPPLAGFFSKLFVFLSLLNVGNYLASIVVIVTSVVSAFYYLWVVKIIYFKDYPVKTYYIPLSKINTQCIVLIVVLNVFVFMFQNAISVWLINLIFSWYF